MKHEVVFIGSTNKQTIKTLHCDAHEINLILANSQYIRLNKRDYKVVQIVKDIETSESDLKITVYVFVTTRTENDTWYL